jgi:hypothetical protein
VGTPEFANVVDTVFVVALMLAASASAAALAFAAPITPVVATDAPQTEIVPVVGTLENLIEQILDEVDGLGLDPSPS